MKKEAEVKDTKKTDLMLVDPRNVIIEEDFNVRKDYGDLEGLMKSIIENGQLEPISGSKVRGADKYVLTDGHRRMKAVMMAIEKGFDIPFVKLLTSTANVEDRIFAMVITGVDKKALNVLEEGEAYKRLVAYSYEPKEIAKKVGKSIAHVYNLLKLSDAPKQVKKAIENEDITATTVMKLIRDVKNTDELINVIEAAVTDAKKGGSTKKATQKNVVSMKSPMQKLTEALVVSGNNETLAKLIVELKRKDSTAETIAELFK